MMRKLVALLGTVVVGVGLSVLLDGRPGREPVPTDMLERARHEARLHSAHLKKPYVIVIDYARSILETRLWVVDLRKGDAIMSSRVSHARRSGGLYAKEFSNTPDTLLSCAGTFVTGERYHGQYGLGMRIDGLEPGVNDNARIRAIVFHPGRFFSAGCFMTPESTNKELVDLTWGGSLVVVNSGP